MKLINMQIIKSILDESVFHLDIAEELLVLNHLYVPPTLISTCLTIVLEKYVNLFLIQLCVMTYTQHGN